MAVTQSIMGFPCGSASKESACNAGDLGSIPGLGRSPGEGNSDPLQYSGLENSVQTELYTVHGVAKSRRPHVHFQSIMIKYRHLVSLEWIKSGGCKVCRLDGFIRLPVWAFPCVCLLSRVRLFVTSWTIYHARLFCPWNFPGKNTGVGCCFLL